MMGAESGAEGMESANRCSESKRKRDREEAGIVKSGHRHVGGVHVTRY